MLFFLPHISPPFILKFFLSKLGICLQVRMDKEGGGHSHECSCMLCQPGKAKPCQTDGTDPLPGAGLIEPLQSAWCSSCLAPDPHCTYGAAPDLCTFGLFGDLSPFISLLKQNQNNEQTTPPTSKIKENPTHTQKTPNKIRIKSSKTCRTINL